MAILSLDRLRTDVAELLREEADAIDVDDNLVDWGLDSIRLMLLVQRWNDAGAGITFADLAERPQLSHWSTLISSRSAER